MRLAQGCAGWALVAVGAFGLALSTAAPQTPAPAQQKDTQASGAPDAVPAASARTIEIQVEMAWLADPATFPCQLAARKVDQVLEVGGFVPNPALRTKALDIARMNSELPIVDKLVVHPSSVIPVVPQKRDFLEKATEKMLGKVMTPYGEPFEFSVDPQGQIAIAGHVPTLEDKLNISRHLSQLPGCTAVANNLAVGKQETSVVLIQPAIVPMPAPAPSPVTPPVIVFNPDQRGAYPAPSPVTAPVIVFNPDQRGAYPPPAGVVSNFQTTVVLSSSPNASAGPELTPVASSNGVTNRTVTMASPPAKLQPLPSTGQTAQQPVSLLSHFTFGHPTTIASQPQAAPMPKPETQPTQTVASHTPATAQPQPKPATQPTQTATAHTPATAQPQPKPATQPTQTATAHTPATAQPQPKPATQPTQTVGSHTPATAQPQPKPATQPTQTVGSHTPATAQQQAKTGTQPTQVAAVHPPATAQQQAKPGTQPTQTATARTPATAQQQTKPATQPAQTAAAHVQTPASQQAKPSTQPTQTATAPTSATSAQPRKSEPVFASNATTPSTATQRNSAMQPAQTSLTVVQSMPPLKKPASPYEMSVAAAQNKPAPQPAQTSAKPIQPVSYQVIAMSGDHGPSTAGTAVATAQPASVPPASPFARTTAPATQAKAANVQPAPVNKPAANVAPSGAAPPVWHPMTNEEQMELTYKIVNTCGKAVVNVQLENRGQNEVVVHVTVRNQAQSQDVVNKIKNMPEIKPFKDKVQFQVQYKS